MAFGEIDTNPNSVVDLVSTAANTTANKIVVLGKGEFGNALAQGLTQSSVPAAAGSLENVSVIHLSAKEFMQMTIESMADVMKNAKFIMYCGMSLTEHADKIAKALIEARQRSNMTLQNKDSPFLEFMDWTNTDPAYDNNKNGTGDLEGSIALSMATSNYSLSQRIWKVTGVSYLDVAGQAKQIATVYHHDSSSSKTMETSPAVVPSLDMPGIVWKSADKSSLINEVFDRLMTRAEVDRWYDALYVGLAIFLYAFGYAFTRYTKYVNGSYSYQMIPLYIVNKCVSWVALWMIVVSPFAGNLLAMKGTLSNWKNAAAIDKIMFLLGIIINILPLILFVLPWIVWYVIRNIHFGANHGYSSGSILYLSQDDARSKGLSKPIKSMLVDLVALKHETGVVGFFFAICHGLMGLLVTDPAYKSKWFNMDEKGRFYGNIELSLACSTVALTLITAVAIRSLFGSASWMKLKPMFNYAAPVGAFLATFHVILMGYSGWNKLFKYSSKRGQPSMTWVTSMFALGVLVCHVIFVMVGTKRRIRKTMKVWRHSLTNAAYIKFLDVKDTYGLSTSHHEMEELNDSA